MRMDADREVLTAVVRLRKLRKEHPERHQVLLQLLRGMVAGGEEPEQDTLNATLRVSHKSS